jgi:nucleotide-binding universal stress UspA family protein
LFRRILVPLDGSEYADKALEVAIELAQKYSASIIMVHVVPVASAIVTGAEAVGSSIFVDLRSRLEISGKHILDEASKRVQAAGLPVVTVLESGNAADKIIQVAEKEEADLIVIGDRGLGMVARFFLGSVATKVTQYAKCPVLIVKA